MSLVASSLCSACPIHESLPHIVCLLSVICDTTVSVVVLRCTLAHPLPAVRLYA